MTNQETAVEFGKSFARTTFNDMLNVNYQGPTFDWNNSKMFEGICAASLFTTYVEIPENIKELEQVAVESLVKEWDVLKEEYLEKNGALPVNK